MTNVPNGTKRFTRRTVLQSVPAVVAATALTPSITEATKPAPLIATQSRNIKGHLTLSDDRGGEYNFAVTIEQLQNGNVLLDLFAYSPEYGGFYDHRAVPLYRDSGRELLRAVTTPKGEWIYADDVSRAIDTGWIEADDEESIAYILQNENLLLEDGLYRRTRDIVTCSTCGNQPKLVWACQDCNATGHQCGGPLSKLELIA